MMITVTIPVEEPRAVIQTYFLDTSLSDRDTHHADQETHLADRCVVQHYQQWTLTLTMLTLLDEEPRAFIEICFLDTPLAEGDTSLDDQ